MNEISLFVLLEIFIFQLWFLYKSDLRTYAVETMKQIDRIQHFSDSTTPISSPLLLRQRFKGYGFNIPLI